MDLNQQVARNTKLSINATAEQRRNFAEKNRAIRAEQGLLRIQQQRSSLHLANLKQEARETRNASNATSGLTRATRGLGGAFAAVGAGLVARELFQVGANSVQASVKVEGFRNSLTALYGDAQVANRVLADLQELSLLPGITFESAVQGAVRLKTVGVEGARAEGVIREFGNAAALAGASSVELGRSLVGFTQILSRGKVSQEEINQVLEAVPLIGVSIREAFGSIDAETIRAQLDAAGQGVQDFTDILVNQLSMGARASADSTRNAFSNLENATFRLHAAIGDRLSPAVRAATGFLTDLANTTADFVIGTDAATEATEMFHAAIVNADNAIARDESITNRIQALREYIAELQEAERNRGIFDRRGRAQLGGEIAGEQVELGRLGLIEAGDVEFIRSLTAEVENLTESFAAHQQIQTQLENTAARYSENQQRRFDIRRENLDEEEDAILAQLQLREGELQAAQEAADGVADAEREKTKATEASVAAAEAATAASLTQSLALARLSAAAEDSSEALSNIVDVNQVSGNLQDAVRASDSYYNALIVNARVARDATKEGSEERRKLDVEIFELGRRQTQERNQLATEAADHNEQEEKRQAESAERLTDARIELAERARAAEVAGFTAAARSGSDYAEQLEALVTPSRRQAYIEIVESFQAQGLSLVEARRKAEPYYDLLLTIATPINAADVAFGDFTSNLVQGANESASAIGSLMNAVNALGTSIATRLPDARGALERAAQREADFFQQNPIGKTFDDIQGEAGEQGRRFVGRLFRRQDRDAEREAIEAQRESIQLYNDLSDATVDFTSSLIDLQEETNLADRGFQDFLGTFARLAAGDFTALLDIPIQLLNISRQAAAERAQGSRDRAALYEEQFGEFERFGRNLSAVSGVLGIPESPELGDSLFFNPAGEFENVLAQSTADFSDGIKNALLASVINLERDIRPEDIAEIFQSGIDRLGETLAQSQFNLNFDEQLGKDTADAYNALITDTTAFYQAQIDVINLVRRTTGNLSFGDPEGLARELQAETNQLSLAAPPLPSSSLYNDQQRQQLIASQQATLRAGGSEREVAVTTDSQGNPIRFDAEGFDAEGFEPFDPEAEMIANEAIRRIEALQTRTANRLAQGALAAITEAAGDVNATETTIIERWNEAVPEIENWWTELYDDIVNNPDLTAIERTESLSALGTQQDFVSSLKSQYVTPVLMGIASATEALETRTANRLAQDALGAISEAASDVNATEQEILDQWTAATPALENWWAELYDDIINNPTLSDAQQSESLTALGTQQDFVSSLKSQYVTPVLSGIAQATEALQTRTANRLAQEALGSLSEATSDVNITEAEVVDLWTATLPALETWYQELLDDANAIANDAERGEALDALGSPEAFIANLKSQYVTPIITAIQTGAEALQTRTANRLAQSALKGLREATSDVNITEAEVINLWTATVPLIETWYQELLDDANAIADDAERGEALDALGSPEAFIANLKSQYVTPILTGIQRSAEALQTKTASRVANTALKGLREAAGDVNITEEAILGLWDTALPLIETWYQELLDDANAIANDAERGEALDALGSPESFIANLKSQYVTPVLMGITQSTEALQTRTANRQAQGAISALRTVADDVNVTEQAIVDKWKEAIPFIESWWQELYDDIVNNANLTDDDIGESLAELGSVEAFVGNIRSQYVTPVLNNILGTQFQNRSNAAQNRVNRSQFNLGGATSESDFETRRDLLIGAINSYYDAEEERIDNLEKSEETLSDLRADNQLARDQAIRRATDATNEFEEERLEKVMEVQEKIDDLRDDALDAERDRADALVDLEQDTQDRILDIERDANRSREDIAQDFLDDNADLRRAYIEDQGDVADALRRGDIDSQEANRQISELSRGFTGDEAGLQRERDRDLRDLDIRTGRREEDAGIRQQQGARDINERGDSQLSEIQQQTATLQSQTALTTATTATTAAETATLESETAVMNAETADDSLSAALGLGEVAEDLSGVDISGLFEVVRESAEASLGIVDAIEGLPAALERSFDNIFEDLSETIIALLNVQSGISGGIGEFLVAELTAADSDITTAFGQITAVALRNLGIDPEQFGGAAPLADVDIGTMLREGATEGTMMGAMNAFADASEMLPVEPRAIPPLNVNSVSITANSVSVSGSSVTGGGGTGDGEVVVNANIDNTLTLPDGATAELGSNQHRLRAQRRSS